jgi:hypothetical protein
MTLDLLLAARNLHTTTKVAARRITTVEAQTLINKASQVPMVRLKVNMVANRCSINRDRLRQVDIIRTTGGKVAEVADFLLDCALVWRAVVVWTACSRPPAIRTRHCPETLGTGWGVNA